MTDLQNAKYSLSMLALELSLMNSQKLLEKKDEVVGKVYWILSLIESAEHVYEYEDEYMGEDPGFQIGGAEDVIGKI